MVNLPVLTPNIPVELLKFISTVQLAAARAEGSRSELIDILSWVTACSAASNIRFPVVVVATVNALDRL